MIHTIDRAASRNAPWVPAHVPWSVLSMMDKAAMSGPDAAARFFLGLYLLRPSAYRLMIDGDRIAAATRRHGGPCTVVKASVFAVRIWREVVASPGTFMRRVDPASTLAIVNCCSFVEALQVAGSLIVDRGSDGNPLSRELVQVCPRRRVLLEQACIPPEAHARLAGYPERAKLSSIPQESLHGQ